MKQLLLGLGIILTACGDDTGGTSKQADAAVAIDSSPDGSTSSGGFVVDGTIVLVGGGTTVTGNVFVLWNGDKGQGDYLYKYGAGTSTPTTFHASVTPPLPADATYGGQFGVGLIPVFDSAFSLADGVVTDESQLETAMKGFAGQYAIIFKGTGSGPGWIGAFPMGLSCGKCVKATSGFDSFTPIACSMVEIQVGPPSAIDVCNWT